MPAASSQICSARSCYRFSTTCAAASSAQARGVREDRGFELPVTGRTWPTWTPTSSRGWPGSSASRNDPEPFPFFRGLCYCSVRMPLEPGTRLGPYEIVGPLGAGGMGEVYRAKDTRLGREVAVKVLPQHLTESPEVRARFEREARTVSSLNHPHICTLHDVGQ